MNIVEKTYIDLTGDLIAGLLLYAIQKQKGNIVKRDEHIWVAKSRKDWWEEIRITEYQYDKAIKILEDKSLVVKKVFKYEGNDWCPTTHLRINEEMLDNM